MSSDTKERVYAIIRLVVGLVIMVAGWFGVSVDADSVAVIVVCIVAIIIFVYSWWKNANITDAACEAQEFLDTIKNDTRMQDAEEEAEEDE